LRARINSPIKPSFSCSISVTVSNPIKSGLLSCAHKVLLCLSPELTRRRQISLSLGFFKPHATFPAADRAEPLAVRGGAPVSGCRIATPYHSWCQSTAAPPAPRFFTRLPVLFAGGPHCLLQRLTATAASPLCEQLASRAAESFKEKE